MTVLETTLLAIILGFGVVGFSTGLIQVVGSLVGSVVGSVVASRIYRQVGGFSEPLFGGNTIAAAVTSFILVFVLASKGVGLFFYLIDRAYKILAFVPGMKLLNRLGGFLLGLVEGIVLVGIVLHFVVLLPIPESTRASVEDSGILQLLLLLTGWLISLFPDTLEKAQSTLQ